MRAGVDIVERRELRLGSDLHHAGGLDLGQVVFGIGRATRPIASAAPTIILQNVRFFIARSHCSPTRNLYPKFPR